MKDIKKEFDEQFIQKGELSEPYLRQYEDRGSAPFYCSLCSMSEIEMSNNKTKDGRYFCDCSYWSEPHNAYVDKSGGKWLGWKDEKKALDLTEEITGIKASNELVNKIWNWFESKLNEVREESFIKGRKLGRFDCALDIEWGQTTTKKEIGEDIFNENREIKLKSKSKSKLSQTK